DIKMPKASCQPSTLTWTIRNIGSSKPQESFKLEVRNSYIGRITFRSLRNGRTIPSGDNRFSVNHGSYTNIEPLTLTYQGARYTFSRYSSARIMGGTSGDDSYTKEYEYWACLK
ncbi:hypothetical protein BGZ97_005649, partial [Linnemannia gamsii]